MIAEQIENMMQYKAALLAAWLALLFVLERLVPRERPPRSAARGWGRYGWRRLGRNAGLWLINTGLNPLVVVPVSLWAASAGPQWRPEWFSGWPGLWLDILILDFWIYWWHRANHEIPFLWRFHEVHHLDRFLDTTTAVRFHFGEVLLSALLRAAVILCLDIPMLSIIVFEVLVMLSSLFHHSNIRIPDRLDAALSHLVITPGIHWVHHHAVRRDTDSNYGTIFSFWDPLFRTRSKTRRFHDMPLGVEGRGAEKPQDRKPLDDNPLDKLLWRPVRFRRSS